MKTRVARSGPSTVAASGGSLDLSKTKAGITRGCKQHGPLRSSPPSCPSALVVGRDSARGGGGPARRTMLRSWTAEADPERYQEGPVARAEGLLASARSPARWMTSMTADAYNWLAGRSPRRASGDGAGHAEPGPDGASLTFSCNQEDLGTRTAAKARPAGVPGVVGQVVLPRLLGARSLGPFLQ